MNTRLFRRFRKHAVASVKPINFRKSPLRKRILLINLSVLLIPIIGVLWAGSYRESLINAEITSLKNEGRLFAVSLAEGALDFSRLNDGDESWTIFDVASAQHLLRRMVSPKGGRARLWNYDKRALLDSRVANQNYMIMTTKLESLNGVQRVFAQMNVQYNRALTHIAWLFSPVHQLPLSTDSVPPYNIADYPEVQAALNGEFASRIRRSPAKDAVLTISVAVPVQRYRKIYGVVQLSRDSSAIDKALAALYKQILAIFAVALVITVILSIWLAKTIASPVNRLAAAANKIRTHDKRKGEIPDLSHRKDEIGDLSISLRNMTQSLWTRMDAIEHFAADVSHELKNPLTSLKSAVETFQIAKTDEQKQRLVQIIVQDVDRLNRLITDVSDASRLDAELSRSGGEISEIVQLTQNIVALYQETTSDQQLESVNATEQTELFVYIQDDRFVQVLRNIITNALSFSPKNGVVQVAVMQEQQHVVITVVDQGAGIPEAAIERIFARFYTERPKGEQFGNHSGLGLFISRQIIEASQGTLTASNRTDGQQGAVFTITLPLVV